MTWITIKTTLARWEADLMEQILRSHGIPVRVLNQGTLPHFGCHVPSAVQVRVQDRWTAMLLLSPVEEPDSDNAGI